MITNFLNKNINSFHKFPAIISDDIKLNYYELSERINICAEQLINFNITEDEHIALVGYNTPELAIILFALWEISAVPVILNYKLTDEDLEKLIIQSNSNKILIHKEFKNRLPGIKKITFPFQYQASEKININNNYPDTKRTALILYTSGTTDSPKGVMLSFKNLINSAESAGNFFNFNPNDRWLVSLPLYHIGGIQILIRSVCYGSAVIFPRSLKTDDIIEGMKEFKPTQISLVATVLSRIIKKNIVPNPEIRNIFLGGGHADDELVKQAVLKNWNIVKVYGSTETSSMVTSITIKDKPDKLSSVGKPLYPNKIMIVDNDGTPLPTGKYGEIIVEGESIMQGYWNNKKESKNHLSGSRFYTGDIGYIDEEGYLYITSRKDNIIISGGENINPSEIEKVMLSFPGIKEARVIGLEDNEWGQIVAAVVVKEKSSSITQNSIIELLKPKLASFKLPKKIQFADEIPTTALGKVKLEDLRKLF